MIQNFWKWCFKCSALYYLRSISASRRENFYKEKLLLLSYPQWVELLQAIGETESRIMRQFEESRNLNEAEFYAEKYEKIQETKKLLEGAWI